MEAFLLSTGLVALAEIGDKTQLLAFLLATRFRRPWPIIAGIFVATLLNHALAGAAGALIMAAVPPQVLRWLLGLAFLAMAVWALIPDRLDDEISVPRGGVFVATVVAFFLAEMGDKTQLATIALAAHHPAVYVILGTTLGMMIANVPAVIVGDKLAGRLPLKWVRGISAALFALLGVLALSGAGARFGL